MLPRRTFDLSAAPHGFVVLSLSVRCYPTRKACGLLLSITGETARRSARMILHCSSTSWMIGIQKTLPRKSALCPKQKCRRGKDFPQGFLMVISVIRRRNSTLSLTEDRQRLSDVFYQMTIEGSKKKAIHTVSSFAIENEEGSIRRLEVLSDF